MITGARCRKYDCEKINSFFIMLVIRIGKKTSGAEELKWESTSTEELASLASTEALFGGVRTFLLVGALAGERAEEFLELAEWFAHSPHTFVFEEEKLLKRETNIVIKAGGKVEKQEKSAGLPAGRQGFDPFGLTAALQSRDKKRLWLALTAALHTGEKAEAVAGLLAWKARAMRDVPLARELTFMYHDSHRGAGELELLLERFALKL